MPVGLSITDLIQAGSFVGLLILIVVTGSRRQWVWWSQVVDERQQAKDRLDEMRKDRDEWKGLAQTATAQNASLVQQTKEMTGIVENLTDIVKGGIPTK